jgi:glyoxylase-like metal-dependent hydrolase (beta-lactamase superfamily II)
VSSAPSPDSEHARLAAYDIARIRAENRGPLTRSGTNTWVVGRDPAYVIDPGPLLEAHVAAVVAAVGERGGLGGIALTHRHADHDDAVPALRDRLPAPVAAGDAQAEVRLADGDRFGPLEVVATPGHAPDHLAFLSGRACFTGDAVLGEGSVFIAPHEGALAGYLRALESLRARDLEVLCPGHGPPVWAPREKLDGYIAHRLERERGLQAALLEGRRSVDELLDAAWSDVPREMRPVAALTLAAHLDKLEEEGRLPAGVERPSSTGVRTSS